MIGLGGGIITDVTGFAAATWMRGISWIAVPTNLLAMVDAAIGGKTAVDFLTAKNSIGAFWQPKAVVCDVDFMHTESAKNYRSALAEVVKTAIIGDAQLFDLLKTNLDPIRRRKPDLVLEMVRRCVRVKASIVSRDERESGLRALLNLGHTIGHALEAQGNYSRWTHGEAVSLGLVAALRIGVELGVTPPELADETTSLLSALGLPVDLSAEPLGEAVELIGHDKKRAGDKLRFVLARELGRVELVTLPLADVRRLALRTG
jgi:shikimate kinase/3-dehydroquinate synthase